MRSVALLLAAALLPVAGLAVAAEAEHVVGQGETLNGIANRAGVTSKALADANGLKPPFALRLGQKLKIPRAAVAKSAATKTASAKPVPVKTASLATLPKTSAATKTAANPALVKESMHVVGEGETLGGIANRAKVPRILIAEANGLTEPYDVRPGQKLLIPRTRHYVVKPGDTGFDIAYRHAVPWSQIAVANGLDVKAPVTVGKELLIPTVFDPELPAQPSKAATATAVRTAATANAVATAAVAAASGPATRTAPRFAWPLAGSVRRGWKSTTLADHHDGLDITAPFGAAVRAAAAGTVVFAGNEKEQFGNLVVLAHGDGWNTAYAFLSKVTVKIGDKVAAGERVGLVGATGRARGNELHFEVRRNGVAVDPVPELPKAP
jgi:murein DD-endopeptidase MepM/ murein hydrolase activator NlpD